MTWVLVIVGIIVAAVVVLALAINYAEARVEREKQRNGWE